MKKTLLTLVIAMMTLTIACADDGEAPVITNDTFWQTTSGSYIYSQGGGIFRFPDAQGVEHYYWYGAKYQEAVDYCPKVTEDRTLIISTHQVHDVESLLDHILILSRSNLLLNASVSDICDRYSFEYRAPGEPMDDVIYSEPSVQGNAVITPRKANSPETPLNLELLFNAVTLKKIKN